VGRWVVRGGAAFLQQYRNDSYSPRSPSPNPYTQKKNFTFYMFPGICAYTRGALYASVMRGNPVQWDKVILGIASTEMRSCE